jgi:hypothetical protein
LSGTQLINLAAKGCSNSEILNQALDALLLYDCQYLFVAWTSLYRYKFSLGTELYDVSQCWSPSSQVVDVTINPGITYSKKYLTDLRDQFVALHHDHYEIVKILDLSTRINRLCQKLGVTCFFVNNILPWDLGYFDHISKTSRLPSDTTFYTQNLFNASTRDDDEFFQLYDISHAQYTDTKALSECLWLNLDRSFRQHFTLDIGDDDSHPGVISHRAFARYLLDKMEKLSPNTKYNKQ